MSWLTRRCGIWRRPSFLGGACILLVGGVTGACAQRSVPDVRDAVRDYDAALARGDSKALYGMMSERSRRAFHLADVDKIMIDERAELVDRAHALADASSVVRASAGIRLADGDEATLDYEDRAFRISSAGGLPSAARSPAEALEQLRKALARRSYATLLRVLSPATRSAVESDIRALLEGLTRPEGLSVQISGDVASVHIEGGHFVRLRLDAGVWKVEDFD